MTNADKQSWPQSPSRSGYPKAGSDTIQLQDEDSVHGPSLSCFKPWWAELRQTGQATGLD